MSRPDIMKYLDFYIGFLVVEWMLPLSLFPWHLIVMWKTHQTLPGLSKMTWCAIILPTPNRRRQPALLWKLLDMLRWLETICEAVGKCLRCCIERSRGTSGTVGTTVDSYIDLRVHSDKTLAWSKNPVSFNVNRTILEMFYHGGFQHHPLVA